MRHWSIPFLCVSGGKAVKDFGRDGCFAQRKTQQKNGAAEIDTSRVYMNTMAKAQSQDVTEANQDVFSRCCNHQLLLSFFFFKVAVPTNGLFFFGKPSAVDCRLNFCPIICGYFLKLP